MRAAISTPLEDFLVSTRQGGPTVKRASEATRTNDGAMRMFEWAVRAHHQTASSPLEGLERSADVVSLAKMQLKDEGEGPEGGMGAEACVQ
jgi:hypothetical protein